MRRYQVVLVTSAVLGVAGVAAADYHEVVVTNGGEITGHVRISGAVPALPPQPVFKEQEVCGATLPDERLARSRDGGLRNVVVSLTNIDAGKAVPRDQAVVLDNVKCAFVPHVASASVGQMLNIHNKDPFLHDAHALLGSRTLFNVGIVKGKTVRKPLAEAGLIHINCNVRHTWMHAYLFVAEHPYHTVTNERGEFRLTDVPPGTYTLRAWHELLGSQDRDVSVESGKGAAVDVVFPATAAQAP